MDLDQQIGNALPYLGGQHARRLVARIGLGKLVRQPQLARGRFNRCQLRQQHRHSADGTQQSR